MGDYFTGSGSEEPVPDAAGTDGVGSGGIDSTDCDSGATVVSAPGPAAGGLPMGFLVLGRQRGFWSFPFLQSVCRSFVSFGSSVLLFFLFLAKTDDDIGAAPRISSEPEDPFLFRIFEEVTEGPIAMVRLVK